MPWPEELLGPLDPTPNRKVGRDLRSNSTQEQRECLQHFFERLRTGTVNERYETIGGSVIKIAACGYIITLKGNGRWLDEIKPGFIS